ncbi:MAG: flagellar protein export ATPase FliI [Pseudomonadota bacterium]
MQALAEAIRTLPRVQRYGRVAAVRGLLLEVTGAAAGLAIGGRVSVARQGRESLRGEVVGLNGDIALCLPFGPLDGVVVGARADFCEAIGGVRPSEAWLGRIINAHGEPIDGQGALRSGTAFYPFKAPPPPAHGRRRVGAKIDLGVKVLNLFASCCQGQRMGIFAGSGVGKSVMLSMLARYAAADVNVIGLIGERGREVQDFIEEDLGIAGLERSVVVVATSDEPALARRQAAYLTFALAEFFRDRGAHVLCLVDSVTRFAMAQREIGLAAGEPPTTKGYTPTVFSELPMLLERAGPGANCQGDITGLFTVLVDGDDHNEPVADAVRGILDGHIVCERAIAERGRYPAVNVLKSVSRTMPGCNSPEENTLVTEARRHLSTYENMAELIRLGAYRAGSDPAVDRAIELNEPIEALLSQRKDDHLDLAGCYQALADILGTGQTDAADSGATP